MRERDECVFGRRGCGTGRESQLDDRGGEIKEGKRLVQEEEKTDLVSIRYSVKHCFSSGDGSEEREREREVGGNSTLTVYTQSLPSSPLFSSPFCSHFLSQTQLSHHLNTKIITFH